MKDFQLPQNFPQRVLALILAITVWALIAYRKDSDTTKVSFFVPISYINLSESLEIVSNPPQTINISIEVPRRDLKEVHPSLFQAVVNLKEAVAGNYQYKLEAKNIDKPLNTKITNIVPDQIKLGIESVKQKEFPIKPVLVGELTDNYVISEVILVPETIKVRGPASQINKISQIETKPININGLNSNLDMKLSLIFPDKIRAIDQSTEFIIRIKIGSEPMNLRVDNIPVGLVNNIYVTKINPNKINVLLRGPKSILKNFKKTDIQAVIDLAKYKPGSYKIKSPSIYLPPAIQLQKIWPPIDIWVLKQKLYE